MTAQDLLSIAAESILLGAIALYASLFLDGLMKHHRRISPGQLSLFDVQPEPQPETPAPVPTLNHQILPFKRRSKQPQAVDLSGFNIRQLKAIASAVKLPRYNTCTKAELQARLLAEVERERLVAALAA
jgi:hypothetical protein